MFQNTERQGFEPWIHLSMYTRLPSVLFQPLRHLSKNLLLEQGVAILSTLNCITDKKVPTPLSKMLTYTTLAFWHCQECASNLTPFLHTTLDNLQKYIAFRACFWSGSICYTFFSNTMFF